MKVPGFILFFLTGTLAAKECLTEDEESVLHPGHDYWYRFESHAFAEAVGTTDDKGALLLRCDVTIGHESGCSYYLGMENCSWTGPTSTTQQPLDLISKYPIKFLIVEGEVTEVYTDEKDPLHFVNIKKGALSAFVVKMSSTKEHLKEMHTDIHGTCPMTSHPVGEGTVRTSKDMPSCSFPSKKDWQYSPYSMFWNMSFIQNLINSTTDCEYSFNMNERILKKVFCKERHAIMLESSHNTEVAVQTNIFYTMTLSKSSPQTKKAKYSLNRRTDIRFEYERTPDPRSDNLDQFLVVANTMLAHLVQQSEEEIGLATIPHFTDFVAHLRTSHTLRTLVASAQSCEYLTGGCSMQHTKELGMSFLIDGLVQCNTLPCVEALSYLARSNDIPPAYLNLIYFSWSNMHFDKPAILKYIMNMCIDTDSNLCWLSIGSLLRRTYSEREHLGREELEKLRDVVRYFPSNIRENCGETTPDHLRKLMKDLKVLSNMGKIYLTLIPEGDRQLTECLFRPSVPIHVKISLLETLKSVDPCRSDLSCGAIYKTLLPLLLNETESTTLRILCYDYLVRLPHKYGFEGEIFDVLKRDTNIQVKSYIASSLKSLFKESHKESVKFVRAMSQLLTSNGMSLDTLIHPREARSSSHGIFVPLMSEGIRTTTAKVYEPSDVLPRYFHTDYMTKVFGQVKHLFEARVQSEGLEDIVLLFQKIMMSNLTSEIFSFENFWNAVQEMAKEFQQGHSEEEYKIDIMKNVKKLEEIYRKHNSKAKPSFNLFLDLFGTTISYLSSTEVASLVSSMGDWMASLRKGVDLNTTRVIRLIEAFHQVPTMMGLPLNWTTNATVAFAMRGGVKMEWNELGLHSKVSASPSLALTFLNRMVLDFPTFTQIGVQANSSGFSSTQLQATLDYTKEKKVLSIRQPTKSQKILELYRTNQLIKHNVSTDIADWDIERTSSEWCSDGESLRFCVSKSYPLVTQRVKPWALMSGWCKWKLAMDPIDKKIDSYNLQIVKLPGNKNTELILTAGSQRWLTLQVHPDQVEITGSPNYRISFNKTRGNAILEWKKKRYEIVYNESPEMGERLLSFKTPSNLHRITEEIQHGKRTIRLLYENWNAEDNWLHSLLPGSFWENPSKAWIEFQINWKTLNSMTRQTVCFVQDPHFVIELDARSSETTGHQQVHLNLTKREISSSKILAFVNATYDCWSDNEIDDQKIQLFNITISRKSLAAQIKTVKNTGKLLYEISLNQASMQPKKEDNNYVGWWSREASDSFDLHEHKMRLVVDTQMQKVSSQELVDKYAIHDIHGLQNILTQAQIRLELPSQWIALEGYFVHSRKPTTFRFEEKCVIDSSYNIPQMTSHSVYRADEDNTTLYHQLSFRRASQTKAVHSIDYQSSDGACWEARLKHGFKSSFFDLVSNVSYTCSSDGRHTLLLHSKTNSSDWQMLDTSIEQIIEDKSPIYRYETCNFTHPLLIINVTADWEGLNNHKKKAIFTNRKSGVRSELNIFRSDKLTLRLQMPERRLSYEGDISDDGTKISVRLNYENNTQETDETKDLHLSGQILDEHTQIWNAKVNLDTYSKLKLLLSEGYRTILNNIAEIAKDTNHPINIQLNRTLDEYWNIILKKKTDFMENLSQSVKDTLQSLKPFLETPMSLFSKICDSTKEISLKYYESLKETSVLIWSIDYFDVPSYFSIVNLQSVAGYFLNMFISKDRVVQMEFVTGRILAWNSFREWPRIERQKEQESDSKLAMLFGARSVSTFDGQVYSFSGNCSYLLARDLRRAEFSVVSDQTSLHVFFPEMSLRIDHEDQVFVNGSQLPSRLPLASHNGKVLVRVGSVLEVWSPSLRITCKGKHFLCVFQLSKWHQTFGLLGNADGKSLDGHTPASQLERIVSYEVSGQCASIRLLPPSPACPHTWGGECPGRKAFLDAACYPHTCYAYSAACYFDHHTTPLFCGGDPISLQKKILPRLEVVLLVQEHSSLKDGEKKSAPYKGLESLLTAIHHKFQSNGYSEVLFSLIGFGGEGVHYQPTMHSTGSKVWMPLEDILNDGLKSLEFNGYKNINPLDALQYALQVVARNTFNSKIFIVVTERDQQVSGPDVLQAVQEQLEKNGITLYTFSRYPGLAKGARVYGVRADGLLFPTKSGAIGPYPKGDLAKVSSATRGAVFLSKFLVGNHPPAFFGHVAQELWAKVHHEARLCRRCESASTGWWQELECTIETCDA